MTLIPPLLWLRVTDLLICSTFRHVQINHRGKLNTCRSANVSDNDFRTPNTSSWDASSTSAFGVTAASALSTSASSFSYISSIFKSKSNFFKALFLYLLTPSPFAWSNFSLLLLLFLLKDKSLGWSWGWWLFFGFLEKKYLCLKPHLMKIKENCTGTLVALIFFLCVFRAHS